MITEEQKDTLLSLFGYYDGVIDTQVTHMNEATIPSKNQHLRYEIPVSYFKCTNKILNCKHMSEGGVFGGIN
jgi:hypothetical protein